MFLQITITVSRILIFSIEWLWMVRFTLRPLYPRGQSVGRSLQEPQRIQTRLGTENVLPLLLLAPNLASHADCNVQIVWKICIPAVLYRVILKKKPDSCEPLALKFVVHLLALIYFSYSVKSCSADNLVFCRNSNACALFRCDISALFILLCCYYIKLRGAYGRIVIKTVNWKHLKGNRFCLTCLLTHDNNQSSPGSWQIFEQRTPIQGLQRYRLSDMTFSLLLLGVEQLLHHPLSCI